MVDATRGSAVTLRAMSRAGLVHFAGHAVLDRGRSDYSYLALPTASDSMIRGDAIARSRFQSAPVVVLGACRPAGVRAARWTASTQWLARSSMQARGRDRCGIAVDDAPTAQLMLALHQALRRKLPPAAALRLAQLMAIQSSDPTLNSPRVWAAFSVMGSGGRGR